MNEFKIVSISLALLCSNFIFCMEQKFKKIKIEVISEEENKKLGFELFQATKKENMPKVKELIKNYANLHGEDSIKSYVNFKNHGVYSILSAASANNCKEIAQLLIEKRADVNAKDNIGQTPLISAFIFRCKDIPALLIDNGANVNDKDVEGDAALIWGLRVGCKIDLVKLLIFNGANYNEKNNKGYAPLDMVKLKAYDDILKFLENFEKNNKELFPQLVEGIKNSNQEKIEKLLRLPIYLIDLETGDNALHVAAKMGNFKMFKFILGIRPGLINKKNYNNLIACDVNHEMQVRLILDLKNININKN